MEHGHKCPKKNFEIILKYRKKKNKTKHSKSVYVVCVCMM